MTLFETYYTDLVEKKISLTEDGLLMTLVKKAGGTILQYYFFKYLIRRILMDKEFIKMFSKAIGTELGKTQKRNLDTQISQKLRSISPRKRESVWKGLRESVIVSEPGAEIYIEQILDSITEDILEN